LTSALKGIEAAILERFWRKWIIIVSLMQKGYGKNEYHKYQKEKRTIVSSLERQPSALQESRNLPLYNLIEFTT